MIKYNDFFLWSIFVFQVRVYDPSAQRRPVLDMEFDEYPLTAMGLVANE
jgi:hypothetical protein